MGRFWHKGQSEPEPVLFRFPVHLEWKKFVRKKDVAIKSDSVDWDTHEHTSNLSEVWSSYEPKDMVEVVKREIL